MAAASSGNQEPLLQSTLTRANIGGMKRFFPNRNQSTPQHVKIGDFETEAIDGLLPLAYGAWLCIFGPLMVSLLGAGLIYAAAMLMKDMWYLSYLFFFLFPPLGFALKELRSRLNCQLKEGCTAVIRIPSARHNALLFEAINGIMRRVTQSCEAELGIQREEQSVGTWSWQVSLIPSKLVYSLRVTSKGESRIVELLSSKGDLCSSYFPSSPPSLSLPPLLLNCRF